MGGGEASVSSGHGRRLVTANVSRARRRPHSANTRVCRAAIQIRVTQFKFESRARSRSRDARVRGELNGKPSGTRMLFRGIVYACRLDNVFMPL